MLTLLSSAAATMRHMTEKARIKIAGVVTALFLAAISLAGIATHTDARPAAAPAPAATVQQAPAAGGTLVAAEHHDGGDGEGEGHD